MIEKRYEDELEEFDEQLEDTRQTVISEVIAARHNKGISQKKLEELSGVKQPVIARMEKGRTNPTLDTILKALAPLGMTLKVVSTDEEE